MIKTEFLLKKNKFVTHRQLQEALTEHYHKTGQKLSLPQAAYHLYKNGQIQSEKPEYPNFKLWDIENIDFFIHLCNMIPVYTYILLKDYFENNKELNEANIKKMYRDVMVMKCFNYVSQDIHNHDFFEISYVLSGNACLLFQEEKVQLTEGDFCFVAPKVSHDIQSLGNGVTLSLIIRKSSFEKTFFNLLLQNNILSEFFRSSLFGTNSNSKYLIMKINNSSEANSIIKNLFHEAYNPKYFSNDIMVSYMNILISIILRDYSESIESFDQPDYNEKDNANIPLILQHIQYNYKKASLKYLADFFHYEESYLGKIIKKHTGLNYSDLIRNLRLKNAEHYLKNGSYKISEIAERVGYNSVDHFSRTFKQVYGCSPKQFQNQNKMERT